VAENPLDLAAAKARRAAGAPRQEPPPPVDPAVGLPPALAAIRTHTDEGKRRPPADVLLDIGLTHHLFHDAGGDPFAAVDLGTRTAVFRIDLAEYRDALTRDYYRLTRRGATAKALSDATATLSARARFDGPTEPVFLRVAPTPDGVAVDLGDDTGDAAIITAAGWRIGPAPVHFRRGVKAMPLPRPERSTDPAAAFARIWDHANVDPADRVLLIAWLLGALRPAPSGAYVILMVAGEQGTGKSSLTRVLKSLIDPSAALLRLPPSDGKDLLIAALNAHVLALDNLSAIPVELSDALCAVSIGTALSARKLYTDTDEVLAAVKRPMILNSIDDVATRPDLADRCLHLLLPPMTARRTEAELDRQFEIDAPLILGALLDAVSRSLRDRDGLTLNPRPRMFDSAKWAGAGLPVLGFEAAELVAALQRNRKDMFETALEASPVGLALVKYMEERPTWTGKADHLLALLLDGPAGPAWPKSPKGLLGVLRRLAPALRTHGIAWSQTRTATGHRLVTITRADPAEVEPTATVADTARVRL
jgi:hypothetical protein